ncbi:MAG: class I SAM-dependent methyltransferase [Deltaproteobacteria bacterium]|nr:class I SAM-dependent methyltransferase [Deltaproteobacteria bacterium]MCX7952312.1 class I SAM-dependent methyltransferase [Deltaproteobacteria bacterium]
MLINLFERYWLPEFLVRIAARILCILRVRQIRSDFNLEKIIKIWDELSKKPLDLYEDYANKQHYEIDPAFFEKVLGKRLKYSCCFFENDHVYLNNAEEAMLQNYAKLLQNEKVIKILDLGCGWGSLTGFLSEKFPEASITAVTNSHSQARYVQNLLSDKNTVNVRKQSFADLNFEEEFCAVFAVEMLEHIQNWKLAFKKIARFIRPNGVFIVHFFATQYCPYVYEPTEWSDWMSREFFTGGIMPSPVFLLLQDSLKLEKLEYISGKHYANTANHWLSNLAARWHELMDYLRASGMTKQEANRFLNRWRLFFIGCSEFFGLSDGNIFGVYLAKLRKCA